jgi:hypothetical protein
MRSIALIAITIVCWATNGHALVAFDFTSGGVTSGTNFGNNITYTSGDASAKLTAWADTGLNSVFQNARVRSWNAFGIGICNRDEGRYCNNPEHQIDNSSDNDYLLIVLDDVYDFDSITIDPYDTWDRDVTYWIGTINPLLDLTDYDYSDLAGLGFGDQMDVFNSRSGNPIDILLEGTGNALLIGAWKDETSTYYKKIDRFKIKALYAHENVVPEPASLVLFGSGLMGAFLRRKQKAS